MKLLGAVLILSGSTLVCLHRLADARRERQVLRELAAALELLAHGVRTSLLPLPRLMERRGQGEFADDFFARVLALRESGAPLDCCWRETAQTLPLRPQERCTLLHAADAFGQSEEGVVSVLFECARELRAALTVHRSEAVQSKRLTLTLCFGGGVLLVVMLL